MSEPLSSILDDAPEKPADAPETPAPAEPKEEAAPAEPKSTREPSKREAWREKEMNLQAEGAGMVRDPVTGQFVKKAPAPAAAAEPAKAPEAPPAAAATPPAQPEMTEREKAFQKALLDERRKRQELEQRLSQPAQPAQPKEPPKSFWDDPEGALKAHEARIQQQGTTLLLNTTERLARARHTDFDEKVAEFAELVKVTPGLGQQWLAAPDPAEFAYTTGKNHMLLKQAGSLDVLTEKIRKETEAKVRAQVEAEFRAKAEAAAREREALPPSLNDTRGASGAAARPIWTGPTPLDDILNN